MSSGPQRLPFVDLARAAAVLFMIQGHTLHALLAPSYQGSPVFDAWLYLRGLTSCTFLLLAGLSFGLVTSRQWDACTGRTPKVARRLRRFAMFLLLGYAMRAPAHPLSHASISVSAWSAFTAVDILQLVAVTLIGLQAMAWVAKTRLRFAYLAFAATAVVVLLTPLAWAFDSTAVLPVPLAAYFSTATGSLFPVFPWSAYILAGAGLGVWFSTAGERPQKQTAKMLCAAGAAMVFGGVMLHQVPFAPYGAIDFWKVSPNLFLVKTGSVLFVLAAAARISASIVEMPGIVSILSRESLTVYVVHLFILYGSSWNAGLSRAIGPRLGLAATAGWALGLVASMTLLAWFWHECKHRSANLPAYVRFAVVAMALVYAVS